MLEAEKKALWRMLDKALSRAETEATGAAKAAKAKQQGYYLGREESVEFFYKAPVTLSPTFHEEGYFDAYL